MKTSLISAAGKFRLAWRELTCHNPLPGSNAGIRIQSCAYDTEAFRIHCPERLTLCVQAMNTMIECVVLGAPQSYIEPFYRYAGFPDIELDEQGNLVQRRNDGGEIT